jgi:hypothetical protein
LIWTGEDAKFLDQIWTHQIVAASSINNNTSTSILDDEESLEEIMALLLLRGLWLSTEDTLHNDVLEIRCGSITI